MLKQPFVGCFYFLLKIKKRLILFIMSDAVEFIPLRERGGAFAIDNKLEDKPETEQRLFLAQDEWLKTKSPAAWEEMQSIVYIYAQSLVKKKLKNKKYLDPVEITDAASEATINFMFQYLRPVKGGGQFEIGRSFAVMLNFKVMEALYKSRPEDQHLSLNTLVGDDEKTELIDGLMKASRESFDEFSRIDDPEAFLMKSTIDDYIDEILEEFDSEVDSVYIRTVARLYLVLCLRHPKSRHAKECFIKIWAQDYKCKQAIELLNLELYRRLHR